MSKNWEPVRRNLPYLQDNLAVDNALLQQLLSLDLIDFNEMESLQNTPGGQQVMALVKLLSKKGPLSYQKFLKSLEKLNRGWIIPTLIRGAPVPTESEKVFVATPQKDGIHDLYYGCTKPLGKALIINNKKGRNGSEKDGENLVEVFQKLGFEKSSVQEHFQLFDQSKEDMLRAAKTFADEDHSGFACCVFVILSHGDKGAVKDTHHKNVEISDLLMPFSKSPSLKGKPKLFFIQACRGREPTADGESTLEKFEVQADTIDVPSMPNTADFFVGYATAFGKEAYRGRPSPCSWYITELCQALETHYNKLDLLRIHTIVNAKVSSYLEEKDEMPCRQAPQFVSSLRKLFCFSSDACT